MGMLGSVVLLILGALATANTLSRYRPGLRFWLDLLVPFQGYLGVGAVGYGLYLIIHMVAYLSFIKFAPVYLLAILSAGVVAMGLGGIFGFETARMWLNGRVSEQNLATAESLHKWLATNKTELGYAGLLLGAFGVLMNIFV